MFSVWNDLRHGARLLLRVPGFSLVAVAALAIGIGANTAIFSVVNTLLLKDLPFEDADRLAVIWEHNLPRDRRNNVISPGNFIHWREMQRSFTDLGAASLTFAATVTGEGEPVEVPLQLVTASFFPLLGVNPVIGRPFSTEEDKPGSRVAVISERLWTDRFNRDARVLQRPVMLNGAAHTITGVMPEGFSFLDKTVDVWVPVGFAADARTPRGRWMIGVGRLRPDVPFDRAQQDMERVHGELRRLFPDMNTGWTARVVPLREELFGNVRPALLVMLAAVAFVLLIACANVANLLLARATERRRELAERAALGAARGRLIRQLLAESGLLAAAGGLSGLALAWWGVRILRLFVAGDLPVQRLETVAIDGSVLGFTALISLVSGIAFGLVPALGAAGAGLAGALKEGGRTGSGGRANRARGAFVVVQVALALILLAGAGLLMRSFLGLVKVDAGFDASRTTTMTVSLPGTRYGGSPQRTLFYQRLFEKLEALPGVESTGGVSFLPLAGLGAATSYLVLGQDTPAPGDQPVADVRVVANDYFSTMRIPLLAGRLFNEGDRADAANRVVISEALAQRHWPGEDPLGKRIRIYWNNEQDDEVIGVVGNVRHDGLEAAGRPAVYWPYPRFSYPTMTIAIRSHVDAAAISAAAVRIVRELDPELAVSKIRTMDDVIATSVAQRRLTMQMIAIFAAAALMLAAVGIYGVIAYAVSQRTQEIGIRMALGAQRGDVLRLVVGEAMLLTSAGVAVGVAAGLALTRLMTDLLFGVRPGDPVTFAAVAASLGLVALVASYIPGRRATRVDPAIALRGE